MLLETKKHHLMKKINSEFGLDECMIIGQASKEVKVVDGCLNTEDLMKKFNIPYDSKRLGGTTVNGAMTDDGFLVIGVESPNEEQVLLIMNHLFKNIQEIYEVIIPIPMIEALYGWSDRKISFKDALFMMLPISQAELSRKTGRSKQLFSEIKSGRTKPTLELISKIMNLYPLLPWDYLIASIEE